MMGSMQKYFTYKMSIYCGIPSVTLLGEKADWIDIRRRLDKLPQFGKEPEQLYDLLCTILDYFIRSFESADHPEVAEFWSKIAHHEINGSGPSYFSGWITAFCFWDAKGNCFHRKLRNESGIYNDSERGCDLGGTVFHRIDMEDIPDGYVSVPVLVDDNGHEVNTMMVAGLVGIAASSSGKQLDPGNATPVEGKVTGLDSLQPVAGWWMYELKDNGGWGV